MAIIWYDMIYTYIDIYIYAVILYKYLECTLESDTSKYLIDDCALLMETVKPSSNTDIQNSITKKTCQLYMYIIWSIMICIIQVWTSMRNPIFFGLFIFLLGNAMCRCIPTPEFVHSSYHLWAVQAGWNGNIATCNSRCWLRRIVVFICIFIICCICDCEHLLSEDELLDWLRHLSQSFGQFRGDWSPKTRLVTLHVEHNIWNSVWRNQIHHLCYVWWFSPIFHRFIAGGLLMKRVIAWLCLMWDSVSFWCTC